jgi:hypothetical protein
VVHQLIWVVLSIHSSQFSEDSIVGSFNNHSLFKEVDKFINISEFFVVLN